jgi:hypothetical protein
MAIEKTIELNVDSKGAQTDIDKLADAVKGLDKTFETFSKETKTGLEDIGETSKKSVKGIRSIGKAFKTIAAGAGIFFLLNKAFEVFKELGQKNQKVVDALATVMEVLSIAFNDLFSFITDNSGGIIDTFKAIFEDPAEAIKGLGKSIYDGVVVRFEQLVEVLGLAGKAIGQLVKGEFSAAFDTIKEAGKQTVDVFTGVDDSFESVAETVSNYAKETLEAAKNNVELANNAQLAAAQQSLLVEKYDRQAEQLRQIRDEERNSITDRKKANDDLLEVLESQEKAMLLTADAQLASAQADAAKNNSIENQVAVTEALANRLGVLAQVEGLRSEQKANDLALDRELIELTNSKLESESNLSIERQRFNAEQIDDELNKLEALKEIDLLYAEKEASRLQLIIENTNAETQARVDAQIALDEFMETSRQTNFTNQKAIDDEQAERDQQAADQEIELNKKVKDAKVGMAQQTLGLIGAIAGKGSKIAKGVAIAQATISGIQATQNAYTTAALSPITTVFPAYPFVQAGLAAGFAALNIASIKSTSSTGGGGVSAPSGGGGAAAPKPPSFNIVGASDTNQLADAVAGQEKQPTQAYVVANDVTSAQSLQNNIVEGSTID